MWSGFVHFFTRYAESFTNFVRGSMSKVFTSDMVAYDLDLGEKLSIDSW